ncbi:MAG: Mov34/MPN/PAD-1 family protein [Candidatus Altiarchaeota archaeon]
MDKPQQINFIRHVALEFILGVSSEIYPREFTAQLRAEGETITEVLVIPASTFGEGFATTRRDMIPFDKSIVGSVHSHPGGSFRPSQEDLRYFQKMGKIHLIVKNPYQGIEDIAAYDRNGERVELRIEEEEG